jgi:hypothetical protein
MNDMKYYELIKKWVAEQGWDDEVTFDEETSESRLHFVVNINDQAFKVYIEGDEKRQWLSLYMYTPFNCKQEKNSELLKLFNHLHQNTYFGRMVLLDNGSIQYKQIVGTSPSELSTETIERMYRTGSVAFEHWHDDIAALALTKTTFSDWQKTQVITDDGEAAD